MTIAKFARSAAGVPRRFWVAAAVWTVIVLATTFPVLPIGAYGGSRSTIAPASVLEVLITLATLIALAAPGLALLRPVTAFVLCLFPTVLTAVAVPLTESSHPGAADVPMPVLTKLGFFLAMVAVAYGAAWSRPKLMWLFGLLALSVPAMFAFSSRVVMYTFGYSGQVTSAYWTTDRRWTAFGLYALGVALTLGTTVALRLSATRTRDQRSVDTERAEVDARAALARDLHDIVAHRISLVAVRAETAPYTQPDLSPEARAILAEIATDARTAMEEMRGVLGVLHRSTDDAQRLPQPVGADVKDLVAEARAAGATVEVEGDLPDLDSLTGNTVYRIVQEALTNARRHAPGTPATLRLSSSEETVDVHVANPVIAEVGEPGRGLAGMRERVHRSGGTLEARVVDGRFVVDAVLPRRADA